MTRAGRRVNGGGSVTRRADGRWMGRFYAWSTAGTRKRVTVYGRTRQEATERMREAQERNRQGMPAPDRSWKLADCSTTGWRTSSSPTGALEPTGCMRRSVMKYRAVVGAEQGDAGRTGFPQRCPSDGTARWERQPIRPWTAAEARDFLDAAKDDPLYPAFVLLLVYGLRRGEVLGLRWCDIDEETGVVHVHQQLQRVKGELRLYPVKTAAGRRNLPLLPITRSMLGLRREAQASNRGELGRAWADTGLVFTTRTGRPVEPRNLVRSFRPICDDNVIRVIKVHHVRHTVGSLLKDLGVPARDAQTILGYTRISATLEIYMNTDEQARRDALTRLQTLLDAGQN